MDVTEFHGIQTRSEAMRKVLRLVESYSQVDAPVLIEGETGTGKELVARALHARRSRETAPFVAIDCGALPESIIESELFGYERGAFTGASAPYPGRIQAAAGGTVFLDEMNAVSLPTQGKLLRFLERREFCRVGQQAPVRVDTALIAASNVPVDALVEAGRMRPDFLYRIDVLRIQLPPLRERPEDIPLLARTFLAQEPIARARAVTDVSGRVLEQLAQRRWHGNVRELFNVLRRAVVSADGSGFIDSLPPERPCSCPGPPAVQDVTRPERLESFDAWMGACERRYLVELAATYATAAERVAASGIPERTLYRKMREHGLRLGSATAGRLDGRCESPLTRAD